MTVTGFFSQFPEIWLVDFEFSAPSGERPTPLCMVAREFRSGRTMRMWQDDLFAQRECPFPLGPGALFVAYYASAELGCHLALGWPMPARILDLCVEFKCYTSGVTLPCKRDLLGALVYHGIDGIDPSEKELMRKLAMQGGTYKDEERAALLEYCEGDVVALAKLLPAMAPKIDLPRALLRGRYMAASARMEWDGVPTDLTLLEKLRSNWTAIQDQLIASIDRSYGIYEGRTFKAERFESWLAGEDIPWPRLPSGALNLEDDTFRQMARSYSRVAPIQELRYALSQLRLSELAVGHDGRNRCLLSAFQARTSRNQPSNSKFIFGPSVWLRGLIKPSSGRAIAYLDYEQQEFGIAAALSRDQAMQAAYASGDPYLEFAKQTRAVPPDATKASHKQQRELFKACVLAVQYGMGSKSLAERIGQPEIQARELLRLHRETYPVFWRWSRAAVDHAMLHGWLYTAFSWRVHVGSDANPRSLANFPMQANGAEMLRLACCLATEQGIMVCAPVHDALLIEASADEIDRVVEQAQACMAEASRIVLAGFELRTEAKTVRYPDRYMDPRGEKFWAEVMAILDVVPTGKPGPFVAFQNTTNGPPVGLSVDHPPTLISY
ncbi:MAG: DNA polymerase I [Planctomycetia bacterium]|nr:DNA polymerase I [Planctomycetia bacterium]